MYRHYKCPLKPNTSLSQFVEFAVSLCEQAYYTAKSGKSVRNMRLFLYYCAFAQKQLCNFRQGSDEKIVKKLYNQAIKQTRKKCHRK